MGGAFIKATNMVFTVAFTLYQQTIDEVRRNNLTAKEAVAYAKRQRKRFTPVHELRKHGKALNNGSYYIDIMPVTDWYENNDTLKELEVFIGLYKGKYLNAHVRIKHVQ